MGNHSQRLRNALVATRRLMWVKRGIPLAMLVFWTVVVLFLIWHQGSPKNWKTEMVRFARMNEVQVKSWSQWGSGTTHFDVLVTDDGREFRFRQAEKVLPALSVGEECLLVHEGKSPQAMYICALSTEEDGALIALEDSINAHHQTLLFLWWMLAIGDALCLTLFAMIEVFGLKQERTMTAEFKAEIAKLEARETRQIAYKESKRAGG